MHNAQCTMHNDDVTVLDTAHQMLEKLALWVQTQETGSLSVQNLKHATGILKDIRDILKTDAPDQPVEIKVQIGKEEYAG